MHQKQTVSTPVLQSQFDFVLEHRGAIFTLEPVSLPAQRYADNFLPKNPSLWIERSVSIAPRDLVDVVGGILREGLIVGGAA